MDFKNVDAIWAFVKENKRKLDSCSKPHDFVDDPEDKRDIWKKKICSKCGGRADSIAAHWYNDGLKDGRDGSK